ncbi:hypothetical protein KP509_13G085900 [Ceratopteris richardii]|uniref:Uncharacterized protein n=1 Tax=Ceratopteris richardii TaxID=49495 RepID=A0A8T2THP0_CERRI|nr:hypothetical protein KP509_13G085900 [Ceratopteris richardii]
MWKGQYRFFTCRHQILFDGLWINNYIVQEEPSFLCVSTLFTTFKLCSKVVEATLIFLAEVLWHDSLISCARTVSLICMSDSVMIAVFSALWHASLLNFERNVHSFTYMSSF